MPDVDSHPPGTPAWVDLGSADLDASRAFYGGLFGWEAPEGPPEAGGYTMFHLRGRQVAGLGPLQGGQPPSWSTYVYVADLDATTAAARDAGATIVVEPSDVMGAGRMAVMVDPSGAPISAWQPVTHQGAQIVNEPGSLVWNELTTGDTEKAKAFYTSVFGWGTELAPTEGMEGIEYTMFSNGGGPMAGMMRMTEEFGDMPPHWMTYFGVEDADASALKVSELGGTVVVEPFDTPVGRTAVISDPAGAVFSIIALDPEAG